MRGEPACKIGPLFFKNAANCSQLLVCWEEWVLLRMPLMAEGMADLSNELIFPGNHPSPLLVLKDSLPFGQDLSPPKGLGGCNARGWHGGLDGCTAPRAQDRVQGPHRDRGARSQAAALCPCRTSCVMPTGPRAQAVVWPGRLRFAPRKIQGGNKKAPWRMKDPIP